MLMVIKPLISQLTRPGTQALYHTSSIHMIQVPSLTSLFLYLISNLVRLTRKQNCITCIIGTGRLVGVGVFL